MINRHLDSLNFFSTSLKQLFLQTGKEITINAKDYHNPIGKISLLPSNEKTQHGNEKINKEDSLHLMIIPKHSNMTMTLKNLKSEVSLFNSNFNELNLNLDNSSIDVKDKISKPSSNIILNTNASRVNINSIDSINYLSIKSTSNSQLDTKSLCSNYFKADMQGDNTFKCNLMKIKDNSILTYSNETKLNLNINPLALWTLINVYCVNRKSFINLPLGVLGGKIGSTSFPTLLLFNRDTKQPKLIQSLHEPIITLSKHKSQIRLGLIILSLMVFGLYKAYPDYKYSNKAFTKCKLNQYLIKKSMI